MIGTILRQYGQQITVQRGLTQYRVKAFLQADTGRVDRLTQLHPGPGGLENRRRYIYIGPPEPELQEDDELLVGLKQYLVRSAQQVCGTAGPAYEWAMCVERGETEWVNNG